MEQGTAIAGGEVFALTDEQILGVQPEDAAVADGQEVAYSSGAVPPPLAPASDHRSQAEPPRWLAERMRDPWVGEEARELWEGTQLAQREAAVYRELFATPEDARALKEIYPGGAAEAKLAADHAKELAEIDAAIFGAPGKSAQDLRAGRVQFVERLYAQDPSAFRELVEAGRHILERAANAQPAASADSPATVSHAPVPQELAHHYREFESVTNAELEKSVGGAINRAMQAALPNLKWMEREGSRHDGQGLPLQDRLAAAVREDVETALKSDAALGEQVARVLSGRRFDDASRAQVVRLIDARAQQLVPGAVRRVVGSWTTATLGTKRNAPAVEEKKTNATARSANASPPTQQRTAPQESSRKLTPGRVDYRKWSDEQILDM